MALLYVVGAWLVLQVADVLFEQLGIPGWAFRFVFALLLIFFPLVLVFSWIFEITPEGIKREQHIESESSITHVTAQKINRATMVLLAITILVVAADRFIPRTSTEQTTPNLTETVSDVNDKDTTLTADAVPVADIKSIAVLPFVNMSGDEENEYFSDGLSEELLNSLVAIKALKVTGRTSSFVFKGKNEDLRMIGEKLNVAHILEGSVRKANNRVRITAQLIKVDDGYHLWSETFDRELDDIFKIQEEIAAQVTAALSIAILGAGESSTGLSGTTNTEAWEAYLRGIYIFQQQSDNWETLPEAEKELRKAIEIDPEFDKAYISLFLVKWRQTINGFSPFEEGIAEQKRIVDIAYALAPESSGVQQIRSRYFTFTLDWKNAEAASLKAIKLNPGDIYALNQYSNIAFFNGEYEAAIVNAKKAVDLDPLSITALQYLAFAYGSDGQCDQVAQVVRRAMTLDPEHSRTHYELGRCILNNSNDPQKAMAAFKNETLRWQRITGTALASIASGDSAAVEKALEDLWASGGETASYQFAEIFAYNGDTDKAIEWLQKAYEISDPGISHMKIDPFLDSIRDDDRFKEILKRVGF